MGMTTLGSLAATVTILAVCCLHGTWAAVGSCEKLKFHFASIQINPNDIPVDYVSGSHLTVCESRQGVSVGGTPVSIGTCCSKDTEVILEDRAVTRFKGHYSSTSRELRLVFNSKFNAFDQFFTNLLTDSHRQLDAMFSIAYGTKYTQNKDVFDEFFDNLRNYYKGENLVLENKVKSFFAKIFVRMYELLHPHLELDDAEKQCIERSLAVIHPFGETPEKIAHSIQQALVAARTLAQAIQLGKNVAINLDRFVPSSACKRSLTKMLYCPYCHGIPGLLPCKDYCLNTVLGCTAYHADLHAQWNDYLENVNRLAVRLEGDGAFNLEAVIAPLKDEISTAIMGYQNNDKNISKLVDGECGPSRRKRFTAFLETDEKVEVLQGGKRLRAKRKAGSGRGRMPRTTLSTLIQGLKETVRELKDHWSNLHFKMCSTSMTGMSASAKESNKCWNGKKEGRYTVLEVGEPGASENVDNPEVKVDTKAIPPAVAKAKKDLQRMAQNIRDSLEGQYVPWIDMEVPKISTGMEFTFPSEESVYPKLPADNSTGSTRVQTGGDGRQDSGNPIRPIIFPKEGEDTVDDGSGSGFLTPDPFSGWEELGSGGKEGSTDIVSFSTPKASSSSPPTTATPERSSTTFKVTEPPTVSTPTTYSTRMISTSMKSTTMTPATVVLKTTTVTTKRPSYAAPPGYSLDTGKKDTVVGKPSSAGYVAVSTSFLACVCFTTFLLQSAVL